MMIVYVGLKYSTLWIDLNWKIDLSRKHYVCMIMWFEFLPSWGGEPRVLEVTGAWDAAVSSEQEDQHQRGQERGVIPGRWWVNVTDTAVRNCCSTPVVTAPAQETNTHTHTRLLPHTQIFHGVKKNLFSCHNIRNGNHHLDGSSNPEGTTAEPDRGGDSDDHGHVP